TEVEDREGNVTQYRYDVRGRVVRVIYPDGSEVAYSYDLAGRQTDTIELNGTVTHQVYNAAGQLIQVIQAQGMPDESVTRYVYDSTTGLLTQTIDPLSRKTYYQ